MPQEQECNEFPIQIMEKLSSPSYFVDRLPNGIIIPKTGNVPLVQSLDMYKSCIAHKNIIDPVI